MAKSVTRFETLPNEMILEVCKYFTARELQHSFLGLNRRFSSLIQSIDDLHLAVTNATMNLPFYLSLAKVTKLTIDSVTKKLDLRSLPNVRSLTWIFPAEKQLLQFCKKNPFPHLRCIRVSEIFHYQDISRLLNLIFSNGFPLLQTCHLGHIFELPEFPSANSLRTLTVGKIPFRLLRFILEGCPNLVRLALDANSLLIGYAEELVQHECLRKLCIEGHLTLFETDHLFQLVPNLTDLQINGTFRQNLSSLCQELSNQINTFLPNLKRFRFRFLLVNGSNNQIQRIANRERLHPCFQHEFVIKELDFSRLRISNY